MKKTNENKWLYILLSVLVAIAFWMYVRLGEDPELENRARNVPVVLSGERVLENQGLMVEGLSAETVDLSWSGRWSDVGQLDNDTVTVSVDLSRITEPGSYELDYSINYPPTVMISAISLQRGYPKQITVVISKLHSKNLVIEPEFTGSVADGYRIGEFIVEPETVLISGPQEKIELIQSAKVSLDKKKMKESFSGDLDIILLDKQGMQVDESGIHLSAETAYSYLPILAMKSVPLDIDIIDGGGASAKDAVYTITPDEIVVAGPEEEVELLDRIVLGTVDLAQVVGDYSQEYPILLPAGMDNVSGLVSAQVDLEIRNMVSKRVGVERIVLTNTPKGFNSELVTRVLNLELRGTEEAFLALREEQINVVADLSNFKTSGSYSVPVKITLNKETSVGVLGQYNVVVKISKS